MDSMPQLLAALGGLAGAISALFSVVRRVTTREDVEKMIQASHGPLEQRQIRTEALMDDIRTQLIAVNVQLARLSVLIEDRRSATGEHPNP